MKKQIIFIGAVVAVVITTAFAYTYRESSVQQKVSVFSGVATTSRATFKVGDTTYLVDIASNETVIGAMRALASTGDLVYTGRDYPGLGTFVDSINGKKSADGLYWILYLNGTTTSRGASATVLNVGDVVEWKCEKSF